MRKMDELEMAISLRAIRWAYLFTVLALLGWGILNYINQGKITTPIHLLSFQYLVLFVATQISKAKIGDKGGKKVILFALMCVVFLIGFGALLLFISE